MMGNILFLYLQWHFIDRPKIILKAWGNCLRFNLNYWSVPVLLKTLFSHWRRYRYSYGKGFSPGRYFEAFSFNMLSRSVGFLLRTVLIATGLITEILVFFIGLIVFLVWLALPFILILGLFYGFKILF